MKLERNLAQVETRIDKINYPSQFSIVFSETSQHNAPILEGP